MEATPFTYDDYLALPDDGKRYEVIEGELLVTPASLTQHQEVLTRLMILMGSHVSKHCLGKLFSAPTDVVLSMTDTVQPDILFISKGRLRIIAVKNVVAIPDLIVEIVSPSSAERDREDKRKLYEKYELPEYWIVDPETQTVDLFLYFDNHLNLIETLRGGQFLRSRQIDELSIITGAEVAGRATEAQSAPLTPNPLSPSAGRGGRTRKGGVLQPPLGLISVNEVFESSP
jgi:Uma2 family endonuclease